MAIKQDVYIDDYCKKTNQIKLVGVSLGPTYLEPKFRSSPTLNFDQPVSCVLIEDLLTIIEILVKN